MSDLAVGHFDTVGFITEVNQVRRQRNVSWRQFFRETGIQHCNIKSVLRRKQASITAHTMAALTVWSGVSPLSYMELKKVGA